VQVFRNLEAAALAVGVSASDIAHLRFHIVTDDFQAGLEEVFSAAVRYTEGGGVLVGRMPATTMVAVSSLQLGALIEVELVAVLD
jgi:enamine deaminase RidA (YjgF/YER057c/UK114 family)